MAERILETIVHLIGMAIVLAFLGIICVGGLLLLLHAIQ